MPSLPGSPCHCRCYAIAPHSVAVVAVVAVTLPSALHAGAARSNSNNIPFPMVIELFWANSAIGRRPTQLSCSWLMNAQRYASIAWLRRSVCPSVWWWKAIDILGLMLDSHRNSCHVSEVNRESQSETMSMGSLWCFHISRAKITASRSTAVFFSFPRARKCAIFVNRSMTDMKHKIQDILSHIYPIWYQI